MSAPYHFAADVGNSRVKLGRLAPGRLVAAVSLPPDDPTAWAAQLAEWHVREPGSWVVAGVHPTRRDALIAWLRRQGHAVHLLDDPAELPLTTTLPTPQHAGIDRLLNALAVRPRTPRGHAAVIVNAGTAVVVDLVDRAGVFRGGAILPGLRLMARALHDHTALLPLIDVNGPPAELPATNTPGAMHAAVWFGVAGAIDRLVEELAAAHGPVSVFIGGGDAGRFAPLRHSAEIVGPFLTLDGVRVWAESQ